MIWTAQKLAMFAAPVRVCGLSLMPPTLGQYRILELIENPYLYGGAPFDSDLMIAVLIFKLPWRAGWWLYRHAWALKAAVFLVTMLMWARRERWTKESRKLSRWIKECCWMPERFKADNERAPMPNGVPNSYRMEAALLGKFTSRQLLGMSMPAVNNYLIAMAANKGSEFESLADYMANRLPEGFAYHEEDFPDIQEAMERARKQQAEAEAKKEEHEIPCE